MIIYTLEKGIDNTISLYFYLFTPCPIIYVCIILMLLVHHTIEREDDCRRETFFFY